MSNVFSFSCTYIQMDRSRQSHRYSRVKTVYSDRDDFDDDHIDALSSRRTAEKRIICSTNDAKLPQVGAFLKADIFHPQAQAWDSAFFT